MLQKSGNGLMLCGGQNCCPVLSLKDDFVEIVDDDGNSVKMKKEQALLIPVALEELEKHQ